METAMKTRLLPAVREYLASCEQEWEQISETRQTQLEELVRALRAQRRQTGEIRLIFICTHNSRRSQFAQVWSTAAAAYYGIPKVTCYSGGTETTAVAPLVLQTLREVGCIIQTNDTSTNPHYKVQLFTEGPVLECYSKVYRDQANPQLGFLAITVCSDADQHCPIVEGASARVHLPYDDPKRADNTPQAQDTYRATSRIICRELLWVFRQLREE